MLLILVLFGGAGFLIGALLGTALGRRRLALVLLLAPVAALAYFAVAYFTAPTDPHDCFECTQTLGRSFDILFTFVLATNVVGWWLGALLGAGARTLYRRSASTRPSAP